MSPVTPKRPAVLIVDHGTRNDAANEKFERLARRIGEARPDWLVEHAHMEIAEPGFEAAIDLLVARGAGEVFVHLHFLGAGYHVRESIPELVERVRAKYPDLRIETSDPLGDDPRLLELILDRIESRSGSSAQPESPERD